MKERLDFPSAVSEGTGVKLRQSLVLTQGKLCANLKASIDAVFSKSDSRVLTLFAFNDGTMACSGVRCMDPRVTKSGFALEIYCPKLKRN